LRKTALAFYRAQQAQTIRQAASGGRPRRIQTVYDSCFETEGSGMECRIDWGGPDGMLFVARTGTGHIAAMDGAPEGGGNNLAPRPMEMMLIGAGGCTAYDVVLILKRGRHAVSGCSVALKAERAETDPKVFTRIHFEFTVTGRKLAQAAVERAIHLSHEKYCSATAMLSHTAKIDWSVKIVDTEGPQPPQA
jgi:putative redox protein